MTADKQDPSRKAFEVWLLNRYKPGSAQLQKDADGDYTNVYTLCEWAAWQASREQALASAEDRVTTLYEAQEPPYLVDICRAIRSLK